MLLTPTDIKQAFHLDEVTFKGDVSGVSFDTRTLNKGDLFFALKSESGDGHNYVQKALHMGAVAVVVDHTIEAIEKKHMLLVPSVLEALEKLGTYVRGKSPSFNIAITGSVGKTTVKELIAHVLRHFGETVYSRESFNNHIGVPYSLCQLTPTTKYGVFEIGMNNAGEIAPLAKIIEPNLAVITNIAPSHIGRMGSIENIAHEKADIFLGLSTKGCAILPKDSPHYEILQKRAEDKGIKTLLTFGKSEGSDARLISYAPHDSGAGSRIEVKILKESYTFDIHFPGEHSAMNAVLALLVCVQMGLPAKNVISHLSTFEAVQGRGQRFDLTVDGNHILLIDDAYNANPTSMRAGLEVLAQTQRAQTQKNTTRRIAVLGEMKELGSDSPLYHASLAHVLEDLNIDLVYTVGEDMKHLFDALGEGQKAIHAASAREVIPQVLSNLQNGDIVFVKGSKGSYVSKVVDALKTQGLSA